MSVPAAQPDLQPRCFMGAISETFLAVGHNGCYPSDWAARPPRFFHRRWVPCTSGEDGPVRGHAFPHQAHQLCARWAGILRERDAFFRALEAAARKRGALVMGICNVRRTSTSDVGGRFLAPAAARAQVDRLLAGADVLDLGAEVTAARASLPRPRGRRAGSRLDGRSRAIERQGRRVDRHPERACSRGVSRAARTP
ncbi:MAG: hypothetical protein U0235_14170 [Polyangiaceae bacterium]